MNKKLVFNNGISSVEKHTFYHGSNIEIKDGFLRPKQNFNHVQNGRVSGAFITSNSDYAKFFAIGSCITGRGFIRLDGNKIYFEKLSNNIQKFFYIYTVYEDPEKPFIHDHGTEYYSEQPIKIFKKTKYNVAKEIEKLGYEIYVLDEPLKNKPDKEHHNNFAQQHEMDDRIKNKKYHRVDISKTIEQQSDNIFKTIFKKIFNKQNS